MADLKRAIGMPIDPGAGLPDLRGREDRVKTIAATAAERYAATGNVDAAIAEILAGLARKRQTES